MGIDSYYFPVVFMRSLKATAAASDKTGHWGAYIRGLLLEAAIRDETKHGGEYCRKQTDTVHAEGLVFRNLLIFIRLLTTSLVRDFVLRRFLKSNEELVLKSCVCQEITLESTIH
jgi:hypothetical protein